ncbi:hypothetical protein, partial [Haladaptatus sp. T7]|uniref:hypothetical protein n=1 Tax=Haladaptatus sp. T7 TaxID=2029368 RepID=UPI0022318ABF
MKRARDEYRNEVRSAIGWGGCGVRGCCAETVCGWIERGRAFALRLVACVGNYFGRALLRGQNIPRNDRERPGAFEDFITVVATTTLLTTMLATTTLLTTMLATTTLLTT